MGIISDWANLNPGVYWQRLSGETEEDRVARIQQVCAKGPFAYYEKAERVGEKPQPAAPSYMRILQAHGELTEAVDALERFIQTLLRDKEMVEENKFAEDCGSSLQAFLENFPERIRSKTARVQYIQSVLESILFEEEGETK